MVEGREDPDGGVQAGEDVDHGDARHPGGRAADREAAGKADRAADADGVGLTRAAATGVGVGRTIQATFSELMAPATINGTRWSSAGCAARARFPGARSTNRSKLPHRPRDEIDLLVDCNHAYDVPAAIAYGRAVADCDIGWFEEPVPPEDIDGYVEVRRGQPIPEIGRAHV